LKKKEPDSRNKNKFKRNSLNKKTAIKWRKSPNKIMATNKMNRIIMKRKKSQRRHQEVMTLMRKMKKQCSKELSKNL